MIYHSIDDVNQETIAEALGIIVNVNIILRA